MTNRNQTTTRGGAKPNPQQPNARRRPDGRSRGPNAVPPKRPTPQSAPPRRSHRRTWWTAVPIAVVVLVVLTFLAVAAGSRTPTQASQLSVGSPTASGAAVGSGAVPASAALQAAVGAVSPATLHAVGVPAGVTGPTKVTGTPPPLVGADGKPEILYVGAEYCPYCAAQRWAVAVALSRFGSFSGLETTHSSSSDIDPDTPTLSFYGSTYTSSVLDFTPVELATNEAVGGQYPTLQKLTAAQQGVLDTYDRAPYTTEPGAIPFIDIGNGAVMIGASYNPTVLKGKSFAQIASALSHPPSPIAQAVDGTANALVAAITQATGLHPIR